MTFMAVIFSVFGIVAWVIAGVLLYFRRKTLAKTELMRDVQTSAASEVSATVPGTLVEVKGTLRCEEPRTSEMAEQTCAHYLSQVVRVYEVTDRDSDGDSRTSRRSEVVASNERFAPFVVEDESGAVAVRGEGAEVDGLEVMNRFERETGEAGTITLGGVTVNIGGGTHTLGYRYVEKILPVDSPVYVLGATQEDGQVGAPSDERGRERFLMSYRSEEQLEKKYKRDALWQGLIAVGLFLFGLIFLAVGVGSAVNGFA
jgi:hypothetical protein